MAKTKKYQNFREFYEDEDRPVKNPKMKPLNESQKDKDRFRKQFRFMDPKDLNEDEFDDDIEAHKKKYIEEVLK
jgi:hypothetical protein